jgi:hypothetical protein
MWALTLVFGFGLVQYGLGSHIRAGNEAPTFPLDLYVSGTTFFTLGLGDVVPVTWPGRAVTVLEGGIGFGFLAIVIGYLPVIYQSFSRREVFISMLDARAGSPPTGVELLRRYAENGVSGGFEGLLRDWEYWSAELLESHLSYPVLAYFRSQHDNQSWLGALTTILDASALVIAVVKGQPVTQARLTFAMARHTVVDLTQVFNTRPSPGEVKRLGRDDLEQLRSRLQASGFDTHDDPGERLAHMRDLYEPYVDALARYLQMELPPWTPIAKQKDNWQTTAWEL